MKTVNIALCGTGNVGSSFMDLVLKNKQKIKSNFDVDINLLLIGSRKGEINNTDFKGVLEKDILKVPLKDEIDVVVELIGGTDISYELAKSSLENGKHFVTANKALIAKYGDQLSKIAEKNKVNLEFEASVCGGVPVIRSLKEGLIANKINKVFGIFNGTSNYILSSMDKENKSFNEVLKNAQKLGYAESNPTSDLNGDDVASKLKILSSLCFNSFLNKNIHVEGIKDIDKDDINYAKRLGYKIKLLGYAELIGKNIFQRVHPTLIRNSSYVGSIDGVLNAVIIDGNPVGQSIIQGEGAGPAATTSALISDISSILRGNIKFPFSISNKERKNLNFKDISERFFSAYFRFNVIDKPGVLSNITQIFSRNKVSIKRLVQDPNKNKSLSSIIIITHPSKDKSLNKIIQTINKRSYVKKRSKLIRIDDE